jgi:L-aminopeptidase/D-esterase-like protein
MVRFIVSMIIILCAHLSAQVNGTTGLPIGGLGTGAIKYNAGTGTFSADEEWRLSTVGRNSIPDIYEKREQHCDLRQIDGGIEKREYKRRRNISAPYCTF